MRSQFTQYTVSGVYIRINNLKRIDTALITILNAACSFSVIRSGSSGRQVKLSTGVDRKFPSLTMTSVLSPCLCGVSISSISRDSFSSSAVIIWGCCKDWRYCWYLLNSPVQPEPVCITGQRQLWCSGKERVAESDQACSCPWDKEVRQFQIQMNHAGYWHPAALLYLPGPVSLNIALNDRTRFPRIPDTDRLSPFDRNGIQPWQDSSKYFHGDKSLHCNSFKPGRQAYLTAYCFLHKHRYAPTKTCICRLCSFYTRQQFI